MLRDRRIKKAIRHLNSLMRNYDGNEADQGEFLEEEIDRISRKEKIIRHNRRRKTAELI